MKIIGIDAHKRSHTAVIVNEVGAETACLTVTAGSDGHLQLLRWARARGVERWAIEDCRNMTRRLERDLLNAGEVVIRVPPKLMAKARDAARTYGKSDPIDALAVARAALREPDLPAAELDGIERQLRVLVDHRENLIAQRVACISRLRWHLLDLDENWDPPRTALSSVSGCNAVADKLHEFTGTVAAISMELVTDIERSLKREKDLEKEIQQLVETRASALVAIVGCGALTAAKLMAETAGMKRFRSRDAFAAHCGTAPLPVWSANSKRFRLSRMGNRQLNAAIHRIAVTQLRWNPAARDLLERSMARGKSKTEALRIVKRHITNVVYRALLDDERSVSVSEDSGVNEAAA